ncbi:MAG: TRAP transporter substrate-binding protein [Fusobacterium mortiferum]|jgi:tripartite ATP-independent transporter DctP family solute receptor|nr:TRAP transporter substrate-binding protein [Fusobacterium mortiferum]MDY2801122.1 TRAP transporter substrate-binding protein [Fusobacterium mortiferum]MDY4801663.1 TRAP transporter substrate-binding protein [Fusobacterium mortiferum]
MKKIFSLILIGVLVSGFFIAKGHSPDKKVLKFAYGSNSDVVKQSMAEFGRLLEEKTNGKLIVEYYPDGQLGTEREFIEMVQTGVIDFTKVAGSALESFAGLYSIFGLPYLFDNEEHFYRVMDNKEIMDKFYNSTEHLGFVGLTYYDGGQRSFYTKGRPITKPEDLKGMKIRVMQSETAIKMISLMGGSPVPMSNSETYTSLQQGILDGAESNEFAITTARHGEVVQYYSYDEHTRVPDIVIMSKNTLDSLTEEEKKAVYEAAKESTIYQKAKWKEAVAEAKQQMQDEFGVKINYIPNNSEFRNLTLPMHEEFKQNEATKNVYEEIREMGDKK